jgi:hypothetical protein
MSETDTITPARLSWILHWPRWVPYAAVGWSLIYGALGIYWALSRRGFPYATETVPNALGPVIGRFGPGVSWLIVVLAGIPAAVAGIAMVRGVRSKALRPFFIIAGVLLAGVLLLLMTGLELLVNLGYLPFGVLSLLRGAEFGKVYLQELIQWATIQQLVCLIGGFLWLAATVSYARRSGGACLYCGRRENSDGWQGPSQAAHWGRIAVYVSLAVPVSMPSPDMPGR